MSGLPIAVPAASSPWREVKDGNLEARAILSRHYTYRPQRDQISFFPSRNRNYKHFVGPGQKLVLLSTCGRALFVWRKFISGDGQKGVNCAVFRNEGAGVASALITAADSIAWERWPRERLYTYVNDARVKTQVPGYCFLRARWRFVRMPDGSRYWTKKSRLLLMEMLPEWAKDRGAA